MGPYRRPLHTTHFDVGKPRQFYNHGFVEDTYVTMREAFSRATASMEETRTRAKACLLYTSDAADE